MKEEGAKGTDSKFKISPDTLIDLLMKDVQKRMIDQGLDTIMLPPTSGEFYKRKFWIDWKGTYILTNGVFKGLPSIKRVGEARISFSESVIRNLIPSIEVTFTVDLGLEKLKVIYDFKVISMNREMEGVVTGKISHVTFNIILAVNAFTRKMRLILFQFKDIGSIETDITGLGVFFDYFASKVTQCAVNSMKEEIKHDVERRLQHEIKTLFDHTLFPVPDLPNYLSTHTGQLFHDL